MLNPKLHAINMAMRLYPAHGLVPGQEKPSFDILSFPKGDVGKGRPHHQPKGAPPVSEN